MWRIPLTKHTPAGCPIPQWCVGNPRRKISEHEALINKIKWEGFTLPRFQLEKYILEVHRPGHWAGVGEESRSSRHLSMQAVPWKWWAEGVAGTPLSLSLSDQWALLMHSNSYSPHSSTSVFSCGHSCWCTQTDLLHAAVLQCSAVTNIADALCEQTMLTGQRRSVITITEKASLVPAH